MEDGKLMSVWMFPFVYVFMDTDNEMEDSFRCHQIQDFCEYMIFFSIIQWKKIWFMKNWNKI